LSIVTVLIIVAMLAMNAVFAAFELALASVRLPRLGVLAEQGKRGASAAMAMKGRMEASLAVVQLGITLVGAVAAAVGGAGADEYFSPWLQSQLGIQGGYADALALALIVLPLSGATIVLAELVPKSFAIKNAEWVCLKLSIPMRVFATAVYPVVVAIEWATKVLVRAVEKNVDREGFGEEAGGLHEFLAHAKALRATRVLDSQQERVIVGVGRLSKLRLRDVLVPASEIKYINADERLIEALIRVHLDAHTRFLVTERADDPQSIFGYVNVKDLFFLAKTHPENPSVREITRQMLVLAPDVMLGDAFARMMSEHAHLALVRDAKGEVHGMITLEDILEEVVGDIQDEYDRLPKNVVPAGRQWVVGGGVSLGLLRNILSAPGLGGNDSERLTLHDWLESRVPTLRTGETHTVDGLRVLVRKLRRGKVLEAVLTPETDGPNEASCSGNAGAQPRGNTEPCSAPRDLSPDG